MGLAAALSIASAGCGVSLASHSSATIPVRPRAFVTAFDRVLIAGFLGETVSDRSHDIDISQETGRLLRMTLRSRTSLDVIDSRRIHLPEVDARGASPDESVFEDVAFWKRLGEEYREPLIVTGRVVFKRAGSQSVERQIGPRAVTVWRPRFKLGLRLVFISGRTGEVLESLSLGPEVKQASDDRASALALYLDLMDRLMPEALAVFGHRVTDRLTTND